MIEAWLKSEHPKWQDWRNLGSTSMLEALLLSMDICPNWYRDVVLDTVENYYGTSQYNRKVSQKEFDWIRDIFEYADAEIEKRLNISKSWATKQNWVLGGGISSPADITLNTVIDQEVFLKFAFEKMGFKNEFDLIPDDLKGTLVPVGAEEKSLSSKDWKAKAQLYATGYLEKNPGLTLEMVVGLVSKRFDQEGICTSHSGGKQISDPSIKAALSKLGWFTQAKRKASK